MLHPSSAVRAFHPHRVDKCCQSLWWWIAHCWRSTTKVLAFARLVVASSVPFWYSWKEILWVCGHLSMSGVSNDCLKSKLGQIWKAGYQAIKRLAMASWIILDHLGVSAKAATCDAVSSPTRNAPVKQPNCKPASFSHHFFWRSPESPRFNKGTSASANEDACKNGCVSKEQRACLFLQDGNKISLGQQHGKNSLDVA